MEYNEIPEIPIEISDSTTEETSQTESEPGDSIYIFPSERQFRNQFFMLLFITSTVVLLLLEFKTLYDTSFKLDYNLISISGISLLVSLVWFALLLKFSRQMVWVTIVFIPVSVLVFTLISHRYEFLSLLVPYFYVFDFKALKRLDLVFRFGIDLLSNNPKLLFVAMILTAANLVCSLFIISVAINVPVDEYYIYKMIFIVVMYFWISSFLKNLEKTTVASVVGEYYFHREHSDVYHHLSIVGTRSSGQIALCSLIIGIASTVQFITKLIQKYCPKKILAINWFGHGVTFVSNLLQDLSAYSLVYVGLTGDSFFTASYHCARLFRRNLVVGLFTTAVSRMISFAGKMIVAGIVGYIWLQRTDSEATGFKLAFDSTLGFAVPFYIMGIFTHVFETTIDAGFVCYLIDLDTDICNDDKAHQVYSVCLK